MPDFKKGISALCLLMLFAGAHAQPIKTGIAAKDSLRSYSVLQTAKRWASIDTASIDPAQNASDRYYRLIGGLIWYADLQDEDGDVSGKLLTKLEHYPALYAKVKKIFLTLYPANAVFIVDTMRLNALASDSTNRLMIARIMRVHLLETTLNKENARLDTLKEALIMVKSLDKLNPALDSEKRYISRLTNALRQDDSLQILRNAIQKDSLSIDTMTKAIEAAGLSHWSSEQIQVRIDSIVKDAAANLLQKDSIVKEVRQVIQDSTTKYADFLKAINGGKTPQIIAALSNLQNAAQTYQTEKQDATFNFNSEVTAAQAAFHLPSESEAIDAVAIYLARRMKQEAVMWFFETITRNAQHFELINTFFPNTLTLLRTKEVFEIPNMGAEWKYALSKDFVRMPTNVLTSKWLRDRWPELSRYRPFMDGLISMAGMLEDRYTYRDVIARLYLDRKAKGNDSTNQFDNIVKLVYAVNTELFVPDSARHYRMLKYEDYRALNGKELEMLISLLDMKYDGVFTHLLGGMEQKLGFSKDLRPEDLRLLLAKVSEVTERIEAVRSTFVKEQEKMKEGGKDWEFTTYNVWNSVNQLWSIFDTAWAGKNIFSHALNSSRATFWYAGELFEVYNLISKKNYAGAVNNTLRLVDTIFYSRQQNGDSLYSFDIKTPERLTETFGENALLLKIEKAIKYRDEATLAELKARFNFSIKGSVLYFGKISPMAAIVFERDRHGVQLVRRLAAFLNDAALAQNDKQLSRSIESYALPTGSYKRKRGNWWSLDVNAYPGPYFGYEWVSKKGAEYVSVPPAYVYGFSAPIGITLSKTFGHRMNDTTLNADYIQNPAKLKLRPKHIWRRSKSNLALTFSIVDIGAAVSYRLGNTEPDTLPHQVKWEQFISPGLHLAYGIPSTPLVLMGGAQFTPKLRKFSDAGEQYNAFRVYLGLFFDLPLINLWERRRIVR